MADSMEIATFSEVVSTGNKTELSSLEKEQRCSDVHEIFTALRTQLSDDQAVKELIHHTLEPMEEAVRELYTALQAIHNPGKQTTQAICRKADALLQIARDKLRSLRSVVPIGRYYKFNPMWSFSMHRLITCVSLMHFLQGGTLVTLQEVSVQLQIDSEIGPDKFPLTLEDYLVGILFLASELSRLAVNSVIQGNYKQPFEIFEFVSKLNAGFKLLHFKNDHLRKKYDSLKYDIRKIEEVVYDLTLRGLKPETEELQK